MQDKEFDKLFRDRFEDAELAPVADLWSNIAEELEPKRRRIFPVYRISAAAVVLLALTISLLTIKREKIRLQGAKAMVADNMAPEADDHRIASAIAAPESIDVVEDVVKSTPLVIAPRAKVDVIEENKPVAVQPEKQIVRHDNRIAETFKQPITDVIQKKDEQPVNEVLIASSGQLDEQNEAAAETEPAEHRSGIRNVGDLVNFVVNKVDKREKKFLQFDTDDDDNSSLVSVNIGILKFNRRSSK